MGSPGPRTLQPADLKKTSGRLAAYTRPYTLASSSDSSSRPSRDRRYVTPAPQTSCDSIGARTAAPSGTGPAPGAEPTASRKDSADPASSTSIDSVGGNSSAGPP